MTSAANYVSTLFATINLKHYLTASDLVEAEGRFMNGHTKIDVGEWMHERSVLRHAEAGE